MIRIRNQEIKRRRKRTLEKRRKQGLLKKVVKQSAPA
jgi:capsid protein